MKILKHLKLKLASVIVGEDSFMQNMAINTVTEEGFVLVVPTSAGAALSKNCLYQSNGVVFVSEDGTQNFQNEGEIDSDNVRYIKLVI